LILSVDRPHEPSVPRPSDSGIKSYLGVPVVSGDDVVAVLVVIDVARVEGSPRRWNRRWMRWPTPWRPRVVATAGDRPAAPIEADDTFEVSPQEWLILNQLDGDRPSTTPQRPPASSAPSPPPSPPPSSNAVSSASAAKTAAASESFGEVSQSWFGRGSGRSAAVGVSGSGGD